MANIQSYEVITCRIHTDALCLILKSKEKINQGEKNE